MPLLRKVLFGYILLVAVIGSMAATLLHERNRVFEIETEMRHLDLVQRDVNTAHRYITLLAMRGETALAWEEDDFEDYHALRLRVDTMLQAMYNGNEEFVSQTQLDTLRHLLVNKEAHLCQIMLLFRDQDNPDSLLLTRLLKRSPIKNHHTKKERHRRTVRRKGNSENSPFRITSKQRLQSDYILVNINSCYKVLFSVKVNG